MPRPRFERLEPARRAALLAAAGEEFAEHGYEAASFNRIIERSGLSKGAMYYYFDDKEDLYATVIRDAMQRLVVDSSNMAAATDAASFWRECEAWYARSLHLFQQDPRAVGLARGLVKALSRGAATGTLAELRRLGRAGVDAFVLQGQGLGAIRRDLPPDLLATVLMALEEGIDLWLGERVGSMSDPEIVTTAAMLTRLYRGVAAPPASPIGDVPKKKKKAGR